MRWKAVIARCRRRGEGVEPSGNRNGCQAGFEDRWGHRAPSSSTILPIYWLLADFGGASCISQLRVVTTYHLMSVSEARRSSSALAGLTEPLIGSLDLRNMMTTWSAQYHPIPLGRMEREKTLGRCEGNNHEQQKSERDTKIFCKASDMARANGIRRCRDSRLVIPVVNRLR